jgi:triosephosphate isomerase
MALAVTPTKLVLGNWKMHGSTAKNTALLSELLADPAVNAPHVGVAVPAVYLGQVSAALAGQALRCGAQVVSCYAGQGAYTGEVSAALLADVGCDFVLVGHSERRQWLGESDVSRCAQIEQAYLVDITPVVCVGEPLAARQAGMHEAFVLEQLEALRSVLVGRATVVVAYEPVWAIGTGLTADNAQIEAMHRQIHLKLLEIVGESSNIAVLYGGSVKADNAQGIMAISGVDGVLVGGASLDASQFKKVCYGAAK